jgi:hypothetical protein
MRDLAIPFIAFFKWVTSDGWRFSALLVAFFIGWEVFTRNTTDERVERARAVSCKPYIDALKDARNDVIIMKGERNDFKRENDSLQKENYILKLENTNLQAFKNQTRRDLIKNLNSQ